MTECNFDTNPPKVENDAMAALDILKKGVFRHEDAPVIITALTRLAELEKRIEGLHDLHEDYFPNYEEDNYEAGYVHAVFDAIKHMKGE